MARASLALPPARVWRPPMPLIKMTSLSSRASSPALREFKTATRSSRSTFRSDRVRQITEAFVFDDFDGFERTAPKNLFYATMTEYKEGYPVAIAFPKLKPELVFGEVSGESRPQAAPNRRD